MISVIGPKLISPTRKLPLDDGSCYCSVHDTKSLRAALVPRTQSCTSVLLLPHGPVRRMPTRSQERRPLASCAAIVIACPHGGRAQQRDTGFAVNRSERWQHVAGPTTAVGSTVNYVSFLFFSRSLFYFLPCLDQAGPATW